MAVRQTMAGLTRFAPSTGRAALDLTNTRLGARDLLTTPGDLERWFIAAGLTDHSPTVTRRELESARMLRDGLRPALLEADGPRVADLAEGWLGRAPGRLRVEAAALRPRVDPSAPPSACLLADAVLDALELVRDAPGRVRECAAPHCAFVYLDTSRNRSRRWCSMEKCGARAKASAYYRRHR